MTDIHCIRKALETGAPLTGPFVAIFLDGKRIPCTSEYDPMNQVNIVRLEGYEQPMTAYKMHRDIEFEYVEPPSTYVTPPEILNHPFRTGKL